MKKLIVLAVLLAAVAMAQKPAEKAATKLAEVATPTNVTVDSFIRCMAATGKEKTCRELAEREAKRSEKVANETADATKNNWPKPPAIYGGWGYGGGWGSGYGYNGYGHYQPQPGMVRVTGTDSYGNANVTFYTGH
ncbi:hypothetical protein A3A95_01895 [Candidatus Nomurabacteria bacterium RIFCSPLOWO2_01_FULL_39_18]|uniref:Uncharacterized protein n=1 Tax=Candidatus Nomurabacteria bacterium RIFCSPHIGHO2_01_FULL_40_24b TaxID=1801739 RepID=A0A1F6V9D5_9BACT|nr:MAG: hypothetical protein A2647_00825 [Candidatus Nomurabacteria bacterium RIFCSPHIGHO2_01_FULL_40_24b]OGI90616.1 MAG: hypothetical protein A3A95_01895 [Candidatus Nomurabacteria bacterium RIFCSPLOWO2_01_FULL_39_18]